MRVEHPAPHSEKMEVRTNRLTEKKEQDADQDYPQSDPEIQIICVWDRTIGGRIHDTNAGSRDTVSIEQPPGMQWLRA